MNEFPTEILIFIFIFSFFQDFSGSRAKILSGLWGGSFEEGSFVPRMGNNPGTQEPRNVYPRHSHPLTSSREPADLIAAVLIQKTNKLLSDKIEKISTRYGALSYLLIIFVIILVNANLNVDNSTAFISWMVVK